jgi:hypothetical protein
VAVREPAHRLRKLSVPAVILVLVETLDDDFTAVLRGTSL